jgi:hypothetical protein
MAEKELTIDDLGKLLPAVQEILLRWPDLVVASSSDAHTVKVTFRAPGTTVPQILVEGSAGGPGEDEYTFY